MADMARECP